MRKLRALVALLALLTVPAAARAQAAVAVLGFEPIDVPEDVTNHVTHALRARATQARLRVVPGKPLVEMKLVFGCLDEAAACMAQIGQSLGAEKLLYGAVRKSRTGYSVTLKFLDVGRARIENEQTFQLVKSEARGEALRGHADKWFVATTGLKATGTLRITASVAGAKVSVDGIVVGTSTGLAPVVAGDLRPGKHEIVVEARKHKLFSASVRVGPGDTLEVNAQLEKDEEVVGPVGPTGPTGVVAPTGATDTPGSGSRIAFWTAGGAAVATFAVAIAAGVKVKGLSSDKRSEMEAACSVDRDGPSCLRYMPECGTDTTGVCRYNVVGNDACKAAASYDPLSGRVRNPEVADICKEGKAWATATWVLFPLASAFTAVAGYFFWSGYLSNKSSTKEKSTAARLRLRVEPVVGPGVTAFSATLQF